MYQDVSRLVVHALRNIGLKQPGFELLTHPLERVFLDGYHTQGCVAVLLPLVNLVCSSLVEQLFVPLLERSHVTWSLRTYQVCSLPSN